MFRKHAGLEVPTEAAELIIAQVVACHGTTKNRVFSRLRGAEIVLCRDEIIYRLSREMKPKASVYRIAKWLDRGEDEIYKAIRRHERLRQLARQGSFH